MCSDLFRAGIEGMLCPVDQVAMMTGMERCEGPHWQEKNKNRDSARDLSRNDEVQRDGTQLRTRKSNRRDVPGRDNRDE